MEPDTSICSDSFEDIHWTQSDPCFTPLPRDSKGVLEGVAKLAGLQVLGQLCPPQVPATRRLERPGNPLQSNLIGVS